MIFFNVKEARDFLLKHGVVYTLRHERRVGNDIAVQGNYRKHVILGKVCVEYVKEIMAPVELLDYVNQSGFNVGQNKLLASHFIERMGACHVWFDKAISMQKTSKHGVYMLALYKVTLRRETEEALQC